MCVFDLGKTVIKLKGVNGSWRGKAGECFLIGENGRVRMRGSD